jgi:hypothetical protein
MLDNPHFWCLVECCCCTPGLWTLNTSQQKIPSHSCDHGHHSGKEVSVPSSCFLSAWSKTVASQGSPTLLDFCLWRLNQEGSAHYLYAWRTYTAFIALNSPSCCVQTCTLALPSAPRSKHPGSGRSSFPFAENSVLSSNDNSEAAASSGLTPTTSSWIARNALDTTATHPSFTHSSL